MQVFFSHSSHGADILFGMAIKKELINAIRDSGLTIYAVAKKSGVDQSSLRRFVSHQRGLNLDSMERLAIFFGLALMPVNDEKMKRG